MEGSRVVVGCHFSVVLRGLCRVGEGYFLWSFEHGKVVNSVPMQFCHCGFFRHTKEQKQLLSLKSFVLDEACNGQNAAFGYDPCCWDAKSSKELLFCY